MNPLQKTLKKTPALLLILAVVLLGFTCVYAPRLFSKDPLVWFGNHDQWAYFSPMAYFTDVSVQEGVFPQWNPLIYCGKPFAADPQSAMFYPPNLLRALLNGNPTPLSSSKSIVWLTLAHLLVGALGMYALGRDHGLRRTASLTGSLAFVLGAEMTRRSLVHWMFTSMAAWLPLMALALRKSMTATDMRVRCRWALALGVLLSLNALGVFPQLTLYEGILLGAYGVTYRLLHWYPEKGFRRAVGEMVVPAIVLAVLLGVCAPVLFGGAELIAHSARAKAPGEMFNYSDIRPSPLYFLRGLLTYPGVRYPGSSGLRLAGTVAFLLAGAAFRRRKWREWLPYGIGFAAMLDCSIGPPFPIGWIVARYAPFEVADPARAIGVAGFAFAMLAAFGQDALGQEWGSRRREFLQTACLTMFGGVVLALLWRWPDPYGQVGRLGWAIPAVALVAMSLAPWLRRPQTIGVLLTGCLLAEVCLWGNAHMAFYLARDPYPGNPEPLVRASAFDLENRRVMAIPGIENASMFELKPTAGGYDPLFLTRAQEVIVGKGANAEYYRMANGEQTHRESARGNLFLKRPLWLTRQYSIGELSPKTTLFPVCTTVYLDEKIESGIPEVSLNAVPPSSLAEPVLYTVVLGEATELEPAGVLSLPETALSDRHSALRIAYTAPAECVLESDFENSFTGERVFGMNVELAASTEERIVELPLPDFERIVTKFRLGGASGSVSVHRIELWHDEADEDEHIEIVKWTANECAANIRDIVGSRVLLFTDGLFPGWHASVDGKEIPIFLANGAFKGIEVSAGTHHVVFSYRPNWMCAGMKISALTLAIVVSTFLALCASWRWRGGAAKAAAHLPL